MAFSQYLATALATWIGGSPMPAAPSSIFIGLHTAAGAELSGLGYARIEVDAWGAVQAGAGEQTISNSAVETTPTATGDWTTVTQFRLYDAVSGGNALSSLSPLDAPRTVLEDGTASFDPGTFTFRASTTDMSVYLATQICEWIGGGSLPAAPTIYIAFFDAVPAELSGDGYTRAGPVSWGAPGVVGSTIVIANSAAAVTGTATADWDAATSYTMFDAVSAGNALSTREALGGSGSVTVLTGTRARLAAGDISYTFPFAA